MSDFNWTITPEEFLREVGANYRKRGSWLSIQNCIFCDGGNFGDGYSLNVHHRDGNFFCHRARSCGQKGSFWKLIESFGLSPRDFLGASNFKLKKKKNFVYGKNDEHLRTRRTKKKIC